MSEAWVKIPTEAEVRAKMPPGAPTSAYDFGFIPAMNRLLRAHPRLGKPFFRLFGEVMFNSERLSRAECEMIAAVAASAQDCHY